MLIPFYMKWFFPSNIFMGYDKINKRYIIRSILLRRNQTTNKVIPIW